MTFCIIAIELLLLTLFPFLVVVKYLFQTLCITINVSDKGGWHLFLNKIIPFAVGEEQLLHFKGNYVNNPFIYPQGSRNLHAGQTK